MTAEGTTTRVALLVHSGKTSHEVSTPARQMRICLKFGQRRWRWLPAKNTKLTVEVLSPTQTHIETETGTTQVTTEHEELVIAAGQQMTATINNESIIAPMLTVISPLATPTRPSASPTGTAAATGTANGPPTVQSTGPLPSTNTAVPSWPSFARHAQPTPRHARNGHACANRDRDRYNNSGGYTNQYARAANDDGDARCAHLYSDLGANRYTCVDYRYPDLSANEHTHGHEHRHRHEYSGRHEHRDRHEHGGTANLYAQANH